MAVAKAKAWRKANPEKARQLARKNQIKFRRSPKGRNWFLLNKYGITLDQWDAMLIAQNGRCAICRSALIDPHVDHCHTTKRFRGFLCKPCNTAIGLLRESRQSLEAAIAYLFP